MMTVQGEIQKAQQAVANPSALGLFGLAMVTLVSSSHSLGITADVSYLLPWTIILGFFAQLLAGIYEFKNNNTFEATAFCGYGFFWLGVALSWMIKLGMFGQAAAAVIDPKQLGFAFLGYFIFTVYMTVGAMNTNKVLFIIFLLIDLFFLGLFMSNLGLGGEFWHKLAGWSELFIAIFSFYGSAAQVLNTHTGVEVLPIGTGFGPWSK